MSDIWRKADVFPPGGPARDDGTAEKETISEHCHL